MSLNTPTTASGVWKRKLSNACADATGMRFCSSCWSLKPHTTVQVRKGVQRGGRNICDECNALRIPGRKVK